MESEIDIPDPKFTNLVNLLREKHRLGYYFFDGYYVFSSSDSSKLVILQSNFYQNELPRHGVFEDGSIFSTYGMTTGIYKWPERTLLIQIPCRGSASIRAEDLSWIVVEISDLSKPYLPPGFGVFNSNGSSFYLKDKDVFQHFTQYVDWGTNPVDNWQRISSHIGYDIRVSEDEIKIQTQPRVPNGMLSFLPKYYESVSFNVQNANSVNYSKNYEPLFVMALLTGGFFAILVVLIRVARKNRRKNTAELKSCR